MFKLQKLLQVSIICNLSIVDSLMFELLVVVYNDVYTTV